MLLFACVNVIRIFANGLTAMKIEQHIDQIIEGCQLYNIKELYLVGSAARGEATAESDLDFVVSFNDLNKPGIADRYFDFQKYLENLFAVPVDLIEESAIRNPFFKRAIDRDKTLIYG